MKQISSQGTFFYKRIFPVLFFGFLTCFFIVQLAIDKRGGDLPVVFFVIPVSIAAFSYFVMKRMIFDLADEVLDAGDSLVVRFGSEQERISLSEIINVSYSYMSNPARATLTLRTPGRFGKEITFAPPQSFVPFAKSQIVSDLLERIDAARRG